LRVHARQATLFGIVASLTFFVLLALPFLVAIAMGGTLGTTGTIVLYTIFLVVDLIALILWAVLAIRWSVRAGRGELFTIPLISPTSDRLFRSVRNGEDRETR